MSIYWDNSQLDDTDRSEYTELIRRVTSWVEALHSYLELEKWNLKITFDNTDEKEAKKSDEEDPTTEAEAAVSPEYLSAHVTFYLETMQSVTHGNWRELRATVIHEMLHATFESHTKLALDLLKGQKGPRAVMRRDNERLVSEVSLLKFWGILLPLKP